MAFELPPLPYDYAALEPTIDEATMKLHHGKHHQAYTDKLNEAVAADPALVDKSIAAILSDIASQPKKVGRVLRPRFWKVVTEGMEGKPVVFWMSSRERR